jgi:hypothetical protein
MPAIIGGTHLGATAEARKAEDSTVLTVTSGTPLDPAAVARKAQDRALRTVTGGTGRAPWLRMANLEGQEEGKRLKSARGLG